MSRRTSADLVTIRTPLNTWNNRIILEEFYKSVLKGVYLKSSCPRPFEGHSWKNLNSKPIAFTAAMDVRYIESEDY